MRGGSDLSIFRSYFLVLVDELFFSGVLLGAGVDFASFVVAVEDGLLSVLVFEDSEAVSLLAELLYPSLR